MQHAFQRKKKNGNTVWSCEETAARHAKDTHGVRIAVNAL